MASSAIFAALEQRYVAHRIMCAKIIVFLRLNASLRRKLPISFNRRHASIASRAAKAGDIVIRAPSPRASRGKNFISKSGGGRRRAWPSTREMVCRWHSLRLNM